MDKNRLKEPVYRFLINPGFNKIHIDSTFVVRFNLAAVATVEFIFDEIEVVPEIFTLAGLTGAFYAQ